MPCSLARKVTAWAIAYRDTLKRTTDRAMSHDGLLPGVVQVPHNGYHCVDERRTDHRGYPRIACIIEADMYHLAQFLLVS
ncbi:hypothetical protein ACLK1S_04390 [Escherichia coli]